MLDPFTALSLATAVIQFVDFGCKIVDTGRSLYNLSEGATGANKTLEDVTCDLAAHTEKLGKSLGINGVSLSDQDKAFEKLREKCHKLAKELEKTLNALKVKDSYHGILRGWTSLRKAFKAVSSESKIRDMAKQLEAYRQELAFHLLAILQSDQSTIAQQLTGLAATTERLHQLSLNDIQNTKRDLLVALEEHKKEQKRFKDESFRNQLLMRDMMFRDVSQKIDEMMAASSQLATKADILDKLYFPDMGERHARIKPAHVKTFSWILDDRDTSFRSWLAFHSEVFWIRGKAGSGKSTLMKYIAGNEKVNKLLQKWAGSSKLIKATNYLWSPGSAMQKSLEGLMQSLLFQILSEIPDAIPLALPERWRATSGSYTYRQPWTKEELSQALRTVMATTQDMKYFFFIDGLDEYWGDLEETAQDIRPTAGGQRANVSLEDVHPRAKADQQGLVELIQALGRFPNVKLCVSSRPWNAFQEAFGRVSDRMLNLADLTKEDMRKYTESMLMNDERFAALAKRDPRARQLVVEIRDKARGVFLWVCLVVASLLRGLTNRDGIDELRERVFSFPSDLRAFFNDILHTIDESYRTMTCRMLKLAKYDAPLPLMAFWWLKYEHDDPSYAEMGKMQAIGDLGPQLVVDATRHVNKWCHDLLEVRQVPGNSAGSRNSAAKIDFLHRTVRDFLAAEDVTGFLDKHAGKHFDERLSMCRLQLAEAKTLPGPDRKNGEAFQLMAFEIMRHAKAMEVSKNESPVAILHELDATGKRYHGLSKVSHWTNELPVNASGYGPGDIQLNTHQGHSNFLSFAVSQDLLLFVQQHLNADSSLINKIGRPLLDYAIHRTFSKPNTRDQDVLVDMIQVLLQKGANPNAHAHLWGTMSVWEAFLYNCYRIWEEPQTIGSPQAMRAAELLLKYGAQTNSVVVESRSLQGEIMSASAEECLVRSFGVNEAEEILDHYKPLRTTMWSRWIPLWKSS